MRRLTEFIALCALANGCESASEPTLSAMDAPQFASMPIHQTFTFPVDETDNGLCGFPIAIHSEATVDDTQFLDEQGNIVREFVRFSIADGTFSANGVSLRQGSNHNTTMIQYDELGNAVTITTVGVGTQVFLPDGGVEIHSPAPRYRPRSWMRSVARSTRDDTDMVQVTNTPKHEG